MNYTYTAWGKTKISYYHSGASTTAVKNNLTYRGYYYDSDLGMYYLQSRYYDPNTCRFINADAALYHSMLGYNLFVYCENTPVTRVDPSGDYSVDIKDEDGNPLDDWLFNGGEGGGGYYTGPGSAYYNYSVYTSTSTYDAYLGGYHSSGLTSAMTNQSYYVVPNAVTVVDSMATSFKSIKINTSPYSNLKDPKNVAPGKDFTASQKIQIIQQNRINNNGVVRSDLSGEVLVQPQKSMKGVTPPWNEWQIDHIIPKSAGGTNSFSNAQVLSLQENRIKWYD
jgi:RHS repeat-associated protein